MNNMKEPRKITSLIILILIQLTFSISKLVTQVGYYSARKISDMSGGVGHVTVISWQANWSTTIHFVNLTASTQYTLNSLPLNYTGISQVPTKSLWNQSSQLIQGLTGGFYDNAFWISKYNWTAGTETTSYQAIDITGTYLCRILFFASNSSNFIQIVNTSNSNSKVSFTGFIGMQVLDVKITNQQIFILFVSIPASTYAYIKVLNLNGTIITTLTQTVNTRNIKFDANNNFFILGYNSTVLLYTIPNYYKFLQINLTASIISIATDGKWLMAITSDSKFTQYQLVTGQQFVQISETNNKFVFYSQNSIDKVATYRTFGNNVGRYLLTNDYVCTGGCTPCRTGYNLVGGQCIGGPYVAPFFPTPPPAPTPPSPSSNIIYSCFRMQNGYCAQFCQERCSICSAQLSNLCLSCSDNYHINLNGECTMDNLPFIVAYIVSILSIFRTRSSQNILVLLNNLQLYDFHFGTYQGILQRIFTRLRFIKQKQWELIPIPKLVDWFDEGYRGLPNYNAYTNPKFLQQERQNSIFFQNTKDYFLLCFPITITSFFLFKFLFKKIFHHRLSIYFRVYSLNLYLLGILIFNDLQFIVFLSLRNFQNLFFFDVSFAIIQSIATVIVGFIMISAISIYFWYREYYKGLSKYFLINMYCLNSSQKIMLILYVIRPIIFASIHSMIYSQTSTQLILLAFLQFVTFVFLMILQIIYSPFKVKSIYCLDLLSVLLMLILNILILFKYNLVQSRLAKDQLENCIVLNVYTLSITIILNIIVSAFIYPMRDLINKLFNYEEHFKPYVFHAKPSLQRNINHGKVKKIKTMLNKIKKIPKFIDDKIYRQETIKPKFDENSTVQSLTKQVYNHKQTKIYKKNHESTNNEEHSSKKTKIISQIVADNPSNIEGLKQNAPKFPINKFIQKTKIILHVLRKFK